MLLGLVGKKCGMSRIFTEQGDSIPVSVLAIDPNHITQIKTLDKDGYRALQVTAGTIKASHINKPMSGHFAKAKVAGGRIVHEFRIADDEKLSEELILGAELKLDLFEIGQKVDITGVTKGKGFAGVVKRHHFAMQDATHGNSLSHRAPGSIGQNQSPGKVFKGKKMAGQMGNKRRTIQGLEIAAIDTTRNLILIKGAVPGASGTYVVINPAKKQKQVA